MEVDDDDPKLQADHYDGVSEYPKILDNLCLEVLVRTCSMWCWMFYGLIHYPSS